MGNNLDFSQSIMGRNGLTDTISSIIALNQAKSLDSKKANKRYIFCTIWYIGLRYKGQNTVLYRQIRYSWQAVHMIF